MEQKKIDYFLFKVLQGCPQVQNQFDHTEAVNIWHLV